jgi:hypothetical protein
MQNERGLRLCLAIFGAYCCRKPCPPWAAIKETPSRHHRERLLRYGGSSSHRESSLQRAATRSFSKAVRVWPRDGTLIQRFSEGIDIFLDPTAFQPTLGKNAIDRELKKLRDAVGQHPALSLVEAESHTIGGFGRNDRFSYTQRCGGPGEVANRVLLEAGTASGREPSDIVELRSYLGQYLEEKKQPLGAEDEGRFSLRLLRFRRTFVEKMFAIHSKVELLKRDKQPLGSYARHYYHLFQLSEHPEVGAMLRSAEYVTIKTDYDSNQPRSLFQELFLPGRHELLPQRCSLPILRPCGDYRRGIRGSMPNALLS